ncbi:MAG: F0F1 ATP synthase subunit delta [Sneathiella sp.]|uniref:F0F1 ATP synthase subunit delta n=1 Tax=Sneathiella sp. TaxID=1964365 RepID=UPI000C5C15AF|nr:F0F1 ATP synthase subunit delta [Sneathiella sp.]MAZ03208.1 F0F1 ATP synthase subunit delta [Sneathiella sp.]
MSAENITVSGIAGRYATALFDLAVSAKQLDDVADDLATIKSMMDENADLARLVKSPVISRDDQARAMGAVLEKLGVSDLVRRFIGTVAKNRRLFALSDMIAAYGQLLAAERGEVVARVTSAKKLTKSQLDAVSAALKSAIGSDVSLESDVDESLIGGLVIKVGSRMVDSSIRTKLQNLKFAMKGVG